MKKTKILVTGLNGFIGSRFKDLYKDKFDLIGFSHQGNNSILDRKYTYKLISDSDTNVVLHLAAKTHIDRCEKDRPLGKTGESWLVNVKGTENIANACFKFKKRLLFLSSECVFDGKKSWYRETDKPIPINWYGITKLNAEKKVKESRSQFCILRSTLAFGHPAFYPFDLFHYFADKLSKKIIVKAVADQSLSLTFIDDIVKVIAVLIDKKAKGIFHFAGGRSLSPYQFACLVGKKLNASHLVEPQSLDEYFGEKAKLRLKNATLSSLKLKNKYNIKPSNITVGLEQSFKRL